MSVVARAPALVDPALVQARRRRRLVFTGRGIFFAVALLAWQALGPVLDPLVFSDPLAIGRRIAEWVGTGAILPHLAVTLEELALGYVLGAAVGILAGFVLGSNEIIAGILDPVIISVYGIPKIALAPLFVVWFGIALTPKVVLVAVLVFFLVFLSTFHGVRGVDPDLLDAVVLMGASRSQVRRWVVVPSALSAIFLGLKMAVPEALVGAVVGEMIVSSRGVGYLIQFATSQLDTAGVFAGLILLMILALIVNGAVNWVSATKGREAR